MKYYELKDKQQKEINELPIKFAFSDEQFKEVINYFNVKEEEIKEKLVSVPGGGFMLKTDLPKLKETFINHAKEINQAMTEDSFLIDAINYELANHEYCITGDITDTVEVLGLDMNDTRVIKCFNIAIKDYERANM